MVQSLKYLLCKHGDLSWILSTHITRLVTRAQNHSSGKAEIGGSLVPADLPAQPSQQAPALCKNPSMSQKNNVNGSLGMKP